MPCRLIQARFASVPSRPARPCPKFRGSRSWLLVPRRASGVSWFLPRIRRSPCETDSASAAHGCQGHRGINGRGPRLRSAAKQAWEAVRLCRERPLHPGARRYGSHQRRPTNDGAQMTVRRGRFGPCAIARGPSHAPAGRAGRRRISAGNHRCVAHSAYVKFNRPSGSSWASFAFPAHACHEARTGHRLAVGTIDKVTTCHQLLDVPTAQAETSI